MGRISCIIKESKEHHSNMLDSQATSAAIYKQLFTDAEWDTISAALDEYIEYDDINAPEDELIGGIPVADRVSSIQSKISTIYRLTENN